MGARLRLAGAVAAAAAGVLYGAAPVVLAAPPADQPRALLVFVPGPSPARAEPVTPDPLLRWLAATPGLAIGLMSPTQGTYTPEQALLDITQGARVSPPAYEPREPPSLGPLLVIFGAGDIGGWPAVVRRARSARGHIVPGRLASAVPGGAAYVTVAEGGGTAATAAADRRGRIAAVSLGPARTVAARARALQARHRLVVVELAGAGSAVKAPLDALRRSRRPRDLLIVVQTPPPGSRIPFLPIARPGPATLGLTSDTTRTAGVVAGIDVLPTVLRHLGIAVPRAVTGQAIRLGPARSAEGLERTRTRYAHVAPRRVDTLLALLAAVLAGGLALAAAAGRSGTRRALRLGALAFMWVPVVVLVPAALVPTTARAEIAIVVTGAFAAAALTDRLLAWPRGPVLPAVVCLLAYVTDLALGLQLVELSLLGPNPRSGARFFGIGNELEPALPIVAFTGLAAAFGSRPRSRPMAWAFGGLGGALAVVVGSGFLGADVGGVITVSAGAAVATLTVLPSGITRRGVLAAAVIPVVSVGLLALLELASGASSHFARTVLQGQGGAGLWEVVARRFEFAYQALVRGLMPLVFGAGVVVMAIGVSRRRQILERLPGPAWQAALLGSLTVGVVGALVNDSGPLLFVVAVFALVLAMAYLVGSPLAKRQGAGGVGEGGRTRRASAPAAMQESSPSERAEGGRPPAPVP